MPLIFGFDIGTTSIGFAVIDHDRANAEGRIHRLGVRIFPESRDRDIPLNHERRQARHRRRQTKRRRQRLQRLADELHHAGLLPARASDAWERVMTLDPYPLRRQAALGEPLEPHEIGRAIYHLAKRRHFRPRELDADDKREGDADEKEAATARQGTLEALKRADKTLGHWLADLPENERKRGRHATRDVVRDEFERVWRPLLDAARAERIADAVFEQRPVFWRRSTLGTCPLIPKAPLCPKGAWLSHQKKMLELLNNLRIIGGNERPLDDEERAAVLDRLQGQKGMSWGGVREVLAAVHRARGEPVRRGQPKFNLEDAGGSLPGNPVEAQLARIFGERWEEYPHKEIIRKDAPTAMLEADQKCVGDNRIEVLQPSERGLRRQAAAADLQNRLGLTEDETQGLAELELRTGWEPYSREAIEACMPLLQEGTTFGELLNGPAREAWRDATFPKRDRPTGEDRRWLPSPADPEEQEAIKAIRNPTVVRVRNELRKVVNNLIAVYGRPDYVRIELAREIGASKRQRDDRAAGIQKYERRRAKARTELVSKGISNPSRRDVDKWLLWEESQRRCPYTGDSISFGGLFQTGEFEIEHIRPRSRSLDDSFGNKTLARKDVNQQKGNRTPYEFFSDRPEEWGSVTERLKGMKRAKGTSGGMAPGKIRRFLAKEIPEGFANRQLTDTGYASRQATTQLQQLWPDTGLTGDQTVFAVAGRSTAHLRRLWGLNNILADNGEKTREDHRHHAIDALVVACCHPGLTAALSKYWQEADDPAVREPAIDPPWRTLRTDASEATAGIVVSHRVRRKTSGRLHEETVYGDTRVDVDGARNVTYRQFARRLPVEKLKNSTHGRAQGTRLIDIINPDVRERVQKWVDDHGGDPAKAFGNGYPRQGAAGSEIRKARVRMKQQLSLMTPVSTGYADLGAKHAISVWRAKEGKVTYEVTSLLDAAGGRRQQNGAATCKRNTGFVMSLRAGDTLAVPAKDGSVEYLVVNGIWSGGQVVVNNHTDSVNKTRRQPTVAGLVKMGAKKVAVDPIGRVRPAGD